MDDRKIHYKSHSVLEKENSYFNKSCTLELMDDLIPWIAPYYNEETDSIFVIFYNNLSSDYICKNLIVIVNDDKIYNINELKNKYTKLVTIDPYWTSDNLNSCKLLCCFDEIYWKSYSVTI